MQTVKIVVTGPFNSGKTEFIRDIERRAEAAKHL